MLPVMKHEHSVFTTHPSDGPDSLQGLPLLTISLWNLTTHVVFVIIQSAFFNDSSTVDLHLSILSWSKEKTKNKASLPCSFLFLFYFFCLIVDRTCHGSPTVS